MARVPRPFGPIRIAAIYLAVSVLWIVVSDRVAASLFGEVTQLVWVQTLKGLTFVTASAGLIFLLVRQERDRWFRSERAATREARRFEAMFRVGPAGMAVLDLATGRVEDANAPMLAMLGYDAHHLIGRTLKELDVFAEDAERRAHLAEIREHGRIMDATAVLRRADGSLRTASWSAELLRLDGVERVLVSALDLSDRTAAYEQTLAGWARALDLRDHETAGHASRVTEVAVALGRRLGLSEHALTMLRWGALLHDIGKIGVPDRILNKPGALTESEWGVMRRHPSIGRRMLEPISFLGEALEVPTWHHERFDGGGYPDGLAGEAIPLSARIFAVVDVFDALTSHRPYRSAWPRDRALAQVRKESGRHFDPVVVAAFLEMAEDGGLNAAMIVAKDRAWDLETVSDVE